MGVTFLPKGKREWVMCQVLVARLHRPGMSGACLLRRSVRTHQPSLGRASKRHVAAVWRRLPIRSSEPIYVYVLVLWSRSPESCAPGSGGGILAGCLQGVRLVGGCRGAVRCVYVTVCCVRATQTVSSPDLMQVGLRARWSPAATGWGMLDWLLALRGGCGGLVGGAGASRSAP